MTGPFGGTPRTLVLRGSVLPMTSPGARAEAVAIRGETIVAVGSVDAVSRNAGPGATVVDYGDCAVLPAFIDAHHHFSLAAYDAGAPDLHLPPDSSVDDVLEIIADHASRDRAGRGWLRMQGYDVHKLAERRPPTRRELDDVCPERPLIVIAYSFHEGVLNSAALAELGWSDRTPDPSGGWLGRHAGRLTGEVGEAAFFSAEARSRTPVGADRAEQWLKASEAHGQALLDAGIVRVADPAVPPEFDRLYDRAVAERRLPLFVHRFPVSDESILRPTADRPPTGSGPDRALYGPAKVILDGADRCAVCFSHRQLLRSVPLTVARIARLRRFGPLRMARELSRGGRLSTAGLTAGLLFQQQEQAVAIVRDVRAAGLQAAQHAIGNVAVDVALTALERTLCSDDDVFGPSRVEHFTLVDPALIRRAHAVGVSAVVQPVWLTEMGGRFEDQVIPRPSALLPLRSMIDAGLNVASSSDYPVASYDVLAGVHAAVTRTTKTGFVLDADERITVDEALMTYTVGAANSLGIESTVGSLQPGMRADLVVLSADPAAVPVSRLASLRVQQTYVGGRPHIRGSASGPGRSDQPEER